MRVDVYSRHDAYVGTIGARQLLSFIWTDCLNGEDTVDITTTYPLKEGYRLVWQDLNGEPHEPRHIRAHAAPRFRLGRLFCSVIGERCSAVLHRFHTVRRVVLAFYR